MEKALQKEGLKMKKCTKCQKEFDWGVEVCPSCGKKVKNAKVEWKKLGELLDYEQPNKYIVKLDYVR